MTVEAASMLCDRCGKREDFVGAVPYAQFVLQMTDPAGNQRTLGGHMCETCAVADPIFEKSSRLVVAHGAGLNGSG
jgi:hypothetical protein